MSFSTLAPGLDRSATGSFVLLAACRFVSRTRSDGPIFLL
jgi:hypothetical protein